MNGNLLKDKTHNANDIKTAFKSSKQMKTTIKKRKSCAITISYKEEFESLKFMVTMAERENVPQNLNTK